MTHKEVYELLDEILADSDKAVVVFPHGSQKDGASSMSVHTYNC